MKVFINVTNHPSDRWDTAQRSAAESYGEIVDMAFPQVSPYADSSEIAVLADDYYKRISEYDCAAVLVQGEFVFTFKLVELLKKHGVTVLSSCSERKVTELTDENGVAKRISEFNFVRFREY